MKTSFCVWLSLVLVCTGSAAIAEVGEVYDVSIIQLIATPKKYARKTVRVIGFLNIAFEGDSIYLHEEDFHRGLTNNGLGIRAEGATRERLETLAGQYVLIEGVFDARHSDAMAVVPFRFWITNITRADPWKVRLGPTPTPSP